jgi:hypothetical protein
MAWSIRVAELLVHLVGLVTVCIKPAAKRLSIKEDHYSEKWIMY